LSLFGVFLSSHFSFGSVKLDLELGVCPHHAFRPQALKELFTVGMVLASSASAQAPGIYCCITRSMDTSRKSWSYHAKLTFNLQDSHIQ
jgi:hypothetical protein